MKRSPRTLPVKAKERVIALALTWDGARWPVRSLPPKARTFLCGKEKPVPAPNSKIVAKLFADDQVDEIRICWAPCLKGGDEVLSVPFQVPKGKRLAYRAVKTVRFGDILCVIYRKQKAVKPSAD